MLILSPFSLISGETNCFSFVSNMLVSSQQMELRKMDQGRLPHSMEEAIQVMMSVGINTFQNVRCDFAKCTIPLQSKLTALASLMFEFYLTRPQMISWCHWSAQQLVQTTSVMVSKVKAYLVCPEGVLT